MKDRKFFVLAVIVAVSVPLIFGCVYFYYMSYERGSNNHIAQLESKREMFIFGEKRIEGFTNRILADSEFTKAESIDFEVDYASGLDAITEYSLYLKEIRVPRKVDSRSFSWQLQIYERERDEYRTIAVGNFSTNVGKINLGRFQIAITDSQRFRLYYYINKEVQSTGLYASIGVE